MKVISMIVMVIVFLLTKSKQFRHLLSYAYNEHIDAGEAESDDAELSDYTLMALNYLERVDQRKDGKKS